MSIKRLVAEKIERLRGMIAVWDSPTASQEEKGKVLSAIIGDEPKFWAEIAKRASATKRVATIKAEEIVQAKPELVATTKTVIAEKAPTPAPPAKARLAPAKPVPATAPARELTEKKSPFEQFIGFLAAFVADKRRLNVSKTCEAAANLLTEGLKMTVDQANTLFAAIRKADSLGLHILDRRTDLAFLENVPAEVLSDHMFGLEGALNTLIAKVRGAGEKDKWIIPLVLFNTRILLVLDKKGGLGEVELSRTEALLIALQGNTEIKFPDYVFEDLRSIVGPVDPHWKGNDMMAKKMADISSQIQ